jgi:hypothetical protein
MKKIKRKHILISVVVFLALAMITIAVAPPPPVNQNIGIYDTLFTNFTESNCRGCHVSGVPTTHHILAQTGQFGCMNCHPVLPDGSGITIIRDCMQCHNNTFNGMTIPRPHHETKDASDGHCSKCHGNIVDDFDDGHYIPIYQPSSMTPDTSFKVINQTSGRKWGGCESCHEADLTATPIIASNNQTHHRLGNLSGFQNHDASKCIRCHDLHNGTYGSDSIRYCERCHGTNSLHNIQYDITNTSTVTGYGHLGAGDCQGCHASYVAANSLEFENIVPTISSINKGQVFEGDTTVLTIKGDDFVTDYNGATHSSIIVVSNEIDGSNLTIAPSNITYSEIVVTIPSLRKGLHGIYVLKDGMKSNKIPLVSLPTVVVTSAIKVNSNTVTISGSGFGTSYNSTYANWTNVTINKDGIIRSVQITSWTDNSISLTSLDANPGDVATVNSIYGTNSTIVG